MLQYWPIPTENEIDFYSFSLEFILMKKKTEKLTVCGSERPLRLFTLMTCSLANTQKPLGLNFSGCLFFGFFFATPFNRFIFFSRRRKKQWDDDWLTRSEKVDCIYKSDRTKSYLSYRLRKCACACEYYNECHIEWLTGTKRIRIGFAILSRVESVKRWWALGDQKLKKFTNAYSTDFFSGKNDYSIVND